MENGNRANGHSGMSWAALAGRWDFSGDSASYLEGSPGGVVGGKPIELGLAISNLQMSDGTVRTRVRFAALPDEPQAARVMIGYQSNRERYVLAQLGASDAAYSLSEWDPDGFGWRPIVATGLKRNLQNERDYLLEVRFSGKRFGSPSMGLRLSIMFSPARCRGRKWACRPPAPPKSSFRNSRWHPSGLAFLLRCNLASLSTRFIAML